MDSKKPKLNFSSSRTVRVHKEQFDAIEKKANSVIIECKEDGRCVAFNRVDDEIRKSKRVPIIDRNSLNDYRDD